jgi:hypothetical protein
VTDYVVYDAYADEFSGGNKFICSAQTSWNVAGRFTLGSDRQISAPQDRRRDMELHRSSRPIPAFRETWLFGGAAPRLRSLRLCSVIAQRKQQSYMIMSGMVPTAEHRVGGQASGFVTNSGQTYCANLSRSIRNFHSAAYSSGGAFDKI